jgi:hypothetical protein
MTVFVKDRHILFPFLFSKRFTHFIEGINGELLAQSFQFCARVDVLKFRIFFTEISYQGVASFPAKLPVIVMLMFT